ncbi:MAG: tRNA lysidine(34) synthetase TilS [Clostridiales bacterium]|nr:tRNA lysidine(34) synthetase TilS [Clostridiales bacterium]
MIKKVKAYVAEHTLLEAFDKIVVGVSGGADSICLLLILLEIRKILPLGLICVHVHHGMRGDEADRDASFVENFCKEREITFFEQRYDVRKYAEKEKISEEEAGRNLRYAFFHQIKERFNYNKIAVAHNKGDQVETILFNLCRGAGVVGLKGIEPVSGDIIRPLLSCSRKEIENYLSFQGINWCTDSTNLSNEYMRNKIRLELIPFLESEINPMSVEHIWAAGTHLQEVNHYLTRQCEVAYNKLAIAIGGKISISVIDLKKEDILIQKMVIRKGIEVLSLSLKNITSKHIDHVLELVNNTVGKYVMLPYGIRGIRDYESLVIEKWAEKNEEYFQAVSIVLGESEEYYLKDEKGRLTVSLITSKDATMLKEYEKKPQNSYTKWFDYDKIKDKLLLRTRKEGDYLEINENGGRKKLKRFFIDKKIPLNERDNILLLADGSHIVWIIGYRISEEYKITENTSRILKVQLDGGK